MTESAAIFTRNGVTRELIVLALTIAAIWLVVAIPPYASPAGTPTTTPSGTTTTVPVPWSGSPLDSTVSP